MQIRRTPWTLIATLLWACVSGAQAGAEEWSIDCSKVVGEIRALHGVNNGPLDCGGTVDLSAYHRALALPSVRLHDAHWPNPDVVDMHAVFPRADADPARPESYDFRRTDEYLRPIRASGAQIVYRLGESIEHDPVKVHVHPPADANRWAAACVGIVRHYNEGWADGPRDGAPIRYWEIWNEPENRPYMWTGSDEEFFHLYETAAQAIKQQFPDVRVGGPGFGNLGRVRAGKLEPTPFAAAFLERCRRDSAPFDFFSWHHYGTDPRATAEMARAVRDWLDRGGFTETQSHLNEWNYLPDDDWSPVLPGGQGERRARFYERIGSAEGAAFTVSTLIALQDAPLDVANYYAGDTNPFGLFTRHGVPRKTYFAFKAFRASLDAPVRIACTADAPARSFACAGISRDKKSVIVLVSMPADARRDEVWLNLAALPWTGESTCETALVDATHDLTIASAGALASGDRRVLLPLKAPSVALLTIRKK